MISVADFSAYHSAFYAVTFIGAFVVALFTCVCNPKAKRFHKHKSFILSHDLPNEVPPNNVDLSHAQCSLPVQSTEVEIESGASKLKAISLHRALPDIPQVAGTSTSPVDTPFSNSTSFADVNSNDDVDSLYTVATNNATTSSHNHPYARIRSNLVVDSSTENDTDDYSESRVPALASVAVRNGTNNHHRATIHEPNDTYELEPQPHILRLQLRNNVEPALFNNEEEAKEEISYNTISVREPLSKVLAERENFEHHYNEVEDERISSFYEEITTGSATYSKINEVSLDKPSYGDAMPSTSRDMNDHTRNVSSQGGVPMEANGPLYSLVDKKMKRANCQATPSAPAEANNLYTMVVKSPASSAKMMDSNKPLLQRYSPPPPLPPPFNRDAHPKLNRNTILFGTPTNSASTSQAYNDAFCEIDPQQNIYHKITRVDSEKDPGYETVYKVANPSDQPGSNQNDYGYEAIAIDESDPAYEIVKPDNGYEIIQNELSYRKPDEQSEVDPNYEIIPSTSVQLQMNPTKVPSDFGKPSHLSRANVNNGCVIDESVIIEHL